ncbi:hypothetical protein CFIMG_000318RA [Ceratocystis fimbriata CBS 114723]|uniref:DRBM domain-containing protein n=1 Tax=Ceratocystis fimbriata CBS 114723 TaxID=1035309 RepID=A0A2C5XI99_9PEZI|nr:hypothetical protein CFIMG_000318RA [Ceratocystis fimbriata CBS 114723]
MQSGFYMEYLESLCRRRGWSDPVYDPYLSASGYTCLVLVNGRKYQTDLAYESEQLAQENAAMRAFMVCRNFSVNGGMLARNGIVQGLPAEMPRSNMVMSGSTSSAAMSTQLASHHHQNHHQSHHRSSQGHSTRNHSVNSPANVQPRMGRSSSSSSSNLSF